MSDDFLKSQYIQAERNRVVIKEQAARSGFGAAIDWVNGSKRLYLCMGVVKDDDLQDFLFVMALLKNAQMEADR